jgi:hypothetical protein
MSVREPRLDHPRILFNPDGLYRLRREGDADPFASLIDTLTTQAVADLEEPLPPIELAQDLYLPGGDIWEVRFLLEGPVGIARAATMGRAFGVTCSQVPRQSLAYLLTEDERHRQRASAALVALARCRCRSSSVSR